MSLLSYLSLLLVDREVLFDGSTDLQKRLDSRTSFSDLT